MSWAAAVPAALVAAAWCVLPGLLLTRALGWRGLISWAAAPLLSVSLIATVAVLAGRFGIPWGVWPVVAATVLIGAVTVAVRVLARHQVHRRSSEATGSRPVRQAPWTKGDDGRYAGATLAVGMAVTIAIGWLTAVLAFGPVDTISPTYDAVHHYSAVAHILDTGDGSSLTLGELTTPGRPQAYPAAWHDLVALVVLSSGASVPVASNLVALAVATVVWPLSCVLLVRLCLGRRPGAYLVAPILSTAFTAMPWLVMTWGVLWPNLLGLALVPAGLATVVTLLGLSRGGPPDRPAALLLGVVAIPALGLSHPNALVSLLVLGLSPMVWAAAVSATRNVRAHHYLRAVTVPGAALAAVLAVLWLLAWSPFLASVRSFDWPASIGTREAVLGVLLNAMNERPELPVVSVLVVVGAVFALRRASTGWLVAAHLISALLYVLAVAHEGALTTALTGAWYNDSYRLAALIPVTGVPLAALGVTASVGLLIRFATRTGRLRAATRHRHVLTLVVITVVTAALVLITDGFRIGVHAFAVAKTYQREATWMLQPGQREFLEEAGQLMPPDAVVAANPWTGNALVYPLTGRATMFPHLSGNWTPDQKLIQQRLHDAAKDPQVCAAVRATGLDYVIDGPVSYWPWDERSQAFPGLTGLDKVPGFEPVSSGGGSTLYRIMACGLDRTPAPAPN